MVASPVRERNCNRALAGILVREARIGRDVILRRFVRRGSRGRCSSRETHRGRGLWTYFPGSDIACICTIARCVLNQPDQVVVLNALDAVGENDELAIDFVQFAPLELVAEL